MEIIKENMLTPVLGNFNDKQSRKGIEAPIIDYKGCFYPNADNLALVLNPQNDYARVLTDFSTCRGYMTDMIAHFENKTPAPPTKLNYPNKIEGTYSEPIYGLIYLHKNSPNVINAIIYFLNSIEKKLGWEFSWAQDIYIKIATSDILVNQYKNCNFTLFYIPYQWQKITGLFSLYVLFLRTFSYFKIDKKLDIEGFNKYLINALSLSPIGYNKPMYVSHNSYSPKSYWEYIINKYEIILNNYNYLFHGKRTNFLLSNKNKVGGGHSFHEMAGIACYCNAFTCNKRLNSKIDKLMKKHFNVKTPEKLKNK